MASPKTLTLKTAYAARSERSSFESTASTVKARRRTSLPIVEAYADLVGRGGHLEAMLMSRQPDLNSVHTVYDSVDNNKMLLYEEQFQYKESVTGPVREKGLKESPVIAELKTNVIIKDEFTLVTDLSYQLAARYNRPESAILIQVDHSACLALGGAFDPCYILTITAVPSQMTAQTNQRNAALIQQFMAEILSVPADRGILKFHAIEEHNYAINGQTVASETEKIEKQQRGLNGTARSSIRAPVANNRKSLPSFRKSGIKNEGIKSVNGTHLANGYVPPILPYVDEGRRKSVPETITPSVPELYELSATNGDDSPKALRNSTRDSGVHINPASKLDFLGKDNRPSMNRSKTVPIPGLQASIPQSPPPQTPVSIQDELMAAPSPKVYRNAADKSRQNSSTSLGRKSIESVRPLFKPEPKVLSSVLETSPPRKSPSANSTATTNTRRRSAQNLAPKSTLVDPTTRINAASTTSFTNNNTVGRHNAPTSKRNSHMNEKMRLVDAKALYGDSGIKPNPARHSLQQLPQQQQQPQLPLQRQQSIPEALPALPIHQRMSKKTVDKSLPQNIPPPPPIPVETTKEPAEKGKRRRSFLSALRRTKTPVPAAN